MPIVYALLKREVTEELHLFKAASIPGRKTCIASPWSICRAMAREDKIQEVFCCADEESARLRCAKLGRAVCGNCVKSLYATEEV